MDLRSEIEQWRFLDTWMGVAKWRKEYHETIVIATDTSGFKYGVAILSGNDEGKIFSDFWDAGDDSCEGSTCHTTGFSFVGRTRGG